MSTVCLSSAQVKLIIISQSSRNKELCGASAKEIVFDADPKSFAALLGLIDSQPMTNIRVWSDVELVIALGVRYLFIHLDGAMYRAIGQNHLQGEPWNVFVLASSHDLHLLASRAIADFGRTHLWEYSGGEIAPQVMEAVDGSYAIALLYAMKSHMTYGSRTDPKNGRLDRGQVVDWLGASRAFTV